MENYLY
ncbi:uncharacterized protein FFC1_11628 [Fusarium fujikuroi]|nr:uncharacterized protein FFC1_11628 [Fusarium fujikuroi]